MLTELKGSSVTVESSDRRDDRAFTGDKHSMLFQWLTDVNSIYAVILVSLVTALGSEALTAILMVSFSAPERWVEIGLAIATVVPLVLAPVIVAFFLQMIRRLERARKLIAELAMTDMLTGIYNRRYFMVEAEKEFGKAQRYNLPLSIILYDVDRFKALNDTFGHSAGDEVLRALTSACARCLRSSDVFARYGGEEFAILLPLTDGEAARGLAERVRKEVEQMSAYHESVRLPVTISLGVAEFQPSKVSFDEMLKEADKRLYAAKTNGRNRVGSGAMIYSMSGTGRETGL
jgi:diguanylate cyclase (GGDEF)-like protein